jgi:flagellar biogenesis protein FliO
MSIPVSTTAVLALAEGPAALAGPDLTRYLLICAGMVGGVALLGWFLQRTLARSVRGRADRRALRVLDALPLGGRKRLAVVRVYDRTFVLGLGDKEVSVVTELDRDVPSAKELVPPGKTDALGKGRLERAFEQIRARVAEGRPRPQRTADAPASGASGKRIAPAPAARTAKPARPDQAAGRRLGNGRGLLG